MKRTLLALSAFVLTNGFVANGQLATETFNSGFPATWTMFKVDNNTVSTNFTAPIPTVLTAQAWMNRLRATGDSAMMTVSGFTPPARADRWLVTPSFTVNDPKMIIKWEDWEGGGSGLYDTVQVWVSTSGGANPAAFTQKIYEGRATDFDAATPYGTHGASLASFNGQSVKVAFRNNTYNQGSLRIDNVGTQVMANALDGAMVSAAFPNIVEATSSTPVTIEVSNQGASNITSIQASYQFDAGSPVTQTFTVNIAPLSSTTLTFTTQISNPTVGSHTITANIIQVNGAADPVASNNQTTRNFAVATGTVTRKGIIEEFTSSTCAPCASFNAWYDPLLQSNNANVPSSNFNVIKYQMNWPAPNNDVSYNNDGLLRRNYYGVNSIPDHFVNGMPGLPSGSPQSSYQPEINSSKTAPAYLSISGTYTIKGATLEAIVTVTPNFTLSGANYKLYMSANQYQYQNTGNTTGQLNYYHVMRKMLPDGSGISISSFTAGVPQTFTQTYNYTVGSVTQMSYNFWLHPISGNLVAFVQDNNTKEIMNSVSIPAQWPTSVNNVSEAISEVSLYPNPAKDFATLSFSLEKSSVASINVIDAAGRVVYAASENFNAGKQQVNISTNNFSAGIYNVNIKTESGEHVERLTVVK